MAACAVEDKTGDWTSLRFLVTLRDAPPNDYWEVSLCAFGDTKADCLASADASLAASWENFEYLGVPRAAFRCDTLLKLIYVNWERFNGVWLGTPEAVAVCAARRRRVNVVVQSFEVKVPAMTDAAFKTATGRAPELPPSWGRAAGALKKESPGAKAAAPKAQTYAARRPV